MMAAFFSWFYIPFITILLPGRTGWFSSNFSAAAAQGSSRFFLILWGISVILFFHLMMKEILNQDAQSPQKARLLFLTDLAAWMLLLSVFLPYMPGDRPIVSVFHTSLAFCAALLFFLVLRPRSEILSFGAGAVFPADGGFAWFLPDGLSFVSAVRLPDFQRLGDLLHRFRRSMAVFLLPEDKKSRSITPPP